MPRSKKLPPTVQPESCVISVRIVPRSSKVTIEALAQDLYKIKLTSSPVDGEANKQLVKVLVSKLSIPPSQIEIVSGATSRLKRVRITGFLRGELLSLFCGQQKP
ncbi:DUF167 domain-containing protein [bacterium]|nr:DUF167 domain-containing protein [bacterium]